MFSTNEQLNLVSVGGHLDVPEVWIEGEPSYPERRLWAAVILHTLQEFTEWCQFAERTWRETQQPISQQLLGEIHAVRRQCRHRWFANICDLANVEHEIVLERIATISREFCIDSIPVSAKSETYLSRWQFRQNKSKQRLLG